MPTSCSSVCRPVRFLSVTLFVNPGVGLVQNFSSVQKIVAAERVATLPVVAVFVRGGLR